MTPERRAWIILIGITAVEAVPLGIFTALDGMRFAHSLGFGGAHTGTLPGWLLGLLFAALFAGLSVARSPYIREHLLQLNAMKVFVLLAMAPVTGTFEELYFRKVLMNALATHGAALLLQILASAIVFGLVHAVWGLFGKSLRIAAGAGVATTILGAMMAVVYVASGRSVAACIVSHALINAVIEPWLILAASSRSWRGLEDKE